MNRILILRGGAIGDFILTLPVFAAIRRQWPEARIELASYPRVRRLALETGLADAFESLDAAAAAALFAPEEELNRRQQRERREECEQRNAGRISSVGAQPRQRDSGKSTLVGLGHRFATIPSFDVVLSYLHDPDGAVRENLRKAGARRVICVSPLPQTGHAVDHLLKPLAELGIEVNGGEAPRLNLRQEWLRQGAEEVQAIQGVERSGPVAIHPGSGSPKKNWPAEKFAELARRIAQERIGRPFFVLGEADAAAGEVVRRLAPAVPVVEHRDLLDLAAMLANCRGYVGNDSGITHLAAAVGIPVVALFGPTDPEKWGPRGGNVRIIRARQPTTESLAEIEVEEALHALAAGMM